ncbi:MAG: hypothetical protein RL693_1872 [Verrucomicrobiota bacterium]|jgi:hypothetical protein
MLVSEPLIGYGLMMKLTPDQVEALANEAVTRFIERKEKRYNAVRQKRTRLKRDQLKQAELNRLASQVRGN